MDTFTVPPDDGLLRESPNVMGVLGPSRRLKPGEPAPGFALLDSTDQIVRLADFRGKNVILYFYPAASTPGCTLQARDFRDCLNKLKRADYAVLGVSPDEPWQLAAFAEHEGLNFPLLADPAKTVLTEWGTYGARKVYGRTVLSVIRSTFVVDTEGMISKAHYNVRPRGHVARMLDELDICI